MVERTGKSVRDVGTVYIIKDGKTKVFEINPKIPLEDLQDMKFGMYLDDTELQLACKLLGVTIEQAKKLSIEDRFTKIENKIRTLNAKELDHLLDIIENAISN